MEIEERQSLRDKIADASSVLLEAMSKVDAAEISYADRGVILADVALGIIEQSGYRIARFL